MLLLYCNLHYTHHSSRAFCFHMCSMIYIILRRGGILGRGPQGTVSLAAARGAAAQQGVRLLLTPVTVRLAGTSQRQSKHAHHPHQLKNSNNLLLLPSPPEQPQAGSAYPHQQSGLWQGDDRSPDSTNPAGPSGLRAPQALLLPRHLGITAPRCPTQHARKRAQSLSQAMTRLKNSYTALAIRYTVVDFTVARHQSTFPQALLRECGCEGWLYVFLFVLTLVL